MDPEKRREIAKKAGQKAHALGRAHEFSRDEAKRAGRRGGRKTVEERKPLMDEWYRTAPG